MKTVQPMRATMTKYPDSPKIPAMLEPGVKVGDGLAALIASSVPPLAVVPFGRVPLRMMVEVPLISATVTTDWFKEA